jgi:hypothetical protein
VRVPFLASSTNWLASLSPAIRQDKVRYFYSDLWLTDMIGSARQELDQLSASSSHRPSVPKTPLY